MWFWIGLLTVAGVAVGVAVVARKPKLRRAVVRVVKKQVKRRIHTTQRARRAVKPLQKAPLTGYSQKVGRAPVVGTSKCTPACWTSKKPVYDKAGVMTCDCPCRGRQHGKYHAGSNASLRGRGWKNQARVSGAPAPKKVPIRKPAALPAASSTATATATKPRPDPERSRLLRADSARKMKAHAAANPDCATGTVSARTVRDKGTGKVTQKLTCDTCKAKL